MTTSGLLFADRYRLGGMIGTGGSASVYEATDVSTGVRVALKILHPHLSADSRNREIFIESARMASSVKNDGIAAVRDIGVLDDTDSPAAWMAMELIAGKTLLDHIREGGPLSSADSVRVADALLTTLASVHAAGLVHRDVTPANVMLSRSARTDDLRVTLLDLGIAAFAGLASDTRAGGLNGKPATVQGSANYMAPEQAMGDPADPRSDLYQVSAVLYFCLTGRPPFPRPTVDAVLRAHLSAPPPVASVLIPAVPAALDRVIVRGMLKHPDDRFPNALAMRSALGSAINVRSVSSRASGAGTSVAPDLTVNLSAPEPPTRVFTPLTRAPAGESTTPARASRAPRAAAPGNARESRGRNRRRASGSMAISGLILGALACVALVGGIAANGATYGPPSASPASATIAPTGPAHEALAAEPAAVPVAEHDDASSALEPEQLSMVTVPGTAGLTVDEALALLRAAGLQTDQVEPKLSEQSAGTVLATVPPSGSAAEAGSLVVVHFASGTNAVPDMQGTPRAEAEAALRSAGFVPSVLERADLNASPGTTLATQPAAEQVLALGRVVTLIIAAEHLDPPSTPPATPVVAAEEGRAALPE